MMMPAYFDRLPSITPEEFVARIEAEGYRLCVVDHGANSRGCYEESPHRERTDNSWDRELVLRWRAAAVSDFYSKVADYLVRVGRTSFPPRQH